MHQNYVTGAKRWQTMAIQGFGNVTRYQGQPLSVVHAVAKPVQNGPATAVCGESVTADAERTWLTVPGEGLCEECQRRVPYGPD